MQGLKREIKEEFSTDIAIGDPFAAFTYTNQVKRCHSVEIIYFATFVSPIEEIQLNPEDHWEYGWFEENELDTILTENKRGEDPEIKAIQKGFSILRGESTNFG